MAGIDGDQSSPNAGSRLNQEYDISLKFRFGREIAGGNGKREPL